MANTGLDKIKWLYANLANHNDFLVVMRHCESAHFGAYNKVMAVKQLRQRIDGFSAYLTLAQADDMVTEINKAIRDAKAIIRWSNTR